MDMKPILYVEDEPDYQVLVSGILAEAGLITEVADTGDEGLEWLSRKKPSLLLLDVNLPDTNGYDLCGRIRQEEAWADIPVMMLTVRGRHSEWLEGLSKGADDYLSKPFNPPELVERVQSILNGKPGRRLNPNDPEHLLIEAALAGNRRAFEVLITQYKIPLRHSIGRLADNPALVDEIASDAFTLAFEKLNLFNGESSFFTWLYSIAENEMRVHWRRGNRAAHVELNEEHPPHLSVRSVPASVEEQELHQKAIRKLYKAVGELPADFRTPLRMHFLGGVAVDEVARQLNIPIGTALSRIFRGKTLLRKVFESYPKPESL